MTESTEHNASRRLPREWLPEPHPPEGSPSWDLTATRIMAAADPELRRLRNRPAALDASWPSVMGLWWKPVAALAAAATALLLLVGRPASLPAPAQDSLALSLIAAEGDPVTLWGAFGIQADPVLALIAFQGQTALSGQDRRPVTPEGDRR